MLILSRRVGEAIQIGDVLVTVASIRGPQVRIAIEAPQSVRIMRTELFAKENKDER